MSSPTDETYANLTICSIQDFMSDRSSLPAVVRVTPSDYEVPDSDDEMPTEVEMLLDKLPKVKFVRVKVLPFTKEDNVLASKGREFVCRRSELVGREFFLPAEYQGSVRCIPRPGSRKSFSTIKQVLEDLPRYVKFNTETPSCNAAGVPNEGQKVASGSILVISKISTSKDSKLRYLTCSIGTLNFFFREDQSVSLDAVDDGQLHRFSELSRLPVLPVCVQFGYINPNEIVCEDDDAAATLLTILSGPLEVLQFINSNMILAWTTNGEDEPCTKVLLLRKTARDRNVLLQASSSDDEAKAYMEKHFRHFNNTHWVRNCLYPLNADKTNTERFIWLKRPITSGESDSPSPVITKSPCTTAEPLQRPKPVASVKPMVAAKPDRIATKQETSPPSSPRQVVHPEAPEKDAIWVEWKRKIKVIHKDLILFVKRKSASNPRNSSQEYLTCIPEMDRESGQRTVVVDDNDGTTPTLLGVRERQTSSDTSNEKNGSESKLTNTSIKDVMSPLKAIEQSPATTMPMHRAPDTLQLNEPNSENQDAAQNNEQTTLFDGNAAGCNPLRQKKPPPPIPLKPFSHSSTSNTIVSPTHTEFFITEKSDTEINDAKEIQTLVIRPLISPKPNLPYKKSDAYGKQNSDASMESPLTVCVPQAYTITSQSISCTAEETSQNVTRSSDDKKDVPPRLPPKPHRAFSRESPNKSIDTTTFEGEEVNTSKARLQRLQPKPRLRQITLDTNTETPSSYIKSSDHAEGTSVTPRSPVSMRILSNESLESTSRSPRSPVSPGVLSSRCLERTYRSPRSPVSPGVLSSRSLESNSRSVRSPMSPRSLSKERRLESTSRSPQCPLSPQIHTNKNEERTPPLSTDKHFERDLLDPEQFCDDYVNTSTYGDEIADTPITKASASRLEYQQDAEQIISDTTAASSCQPQSSLYTDMGSTQTSIIQPIKIHDGYEEMIKNEDEKFVTNIVKPEFKTPVVNSQMKQSGKPMTSTQEDKNEAPIIRANEIENSYTNIAVNPKSVGVENNDDYEDVMETGKTFSDNEDNLKHTATLAKGYADVTKIMSTGQTKEHFYDYSVIDVHECFKMCFPENTEIANVAFKHHLDGCFFRGDGLESFCESTKIGGLQKKKLLKIVNDGWRPKL